MMQAKDNIKKTDKKGERVRRKLNDPKNGHAAKHWAGQRKSEEPKTEKDKKRNAEN